MFMQPAFTGGPLAALACFLLAVGVGGLFWVTRRK